MSKPTGPSTARRRFGVWGVVLAIVLALCALPQTASPSGRAVIGTYTVHRPANLSRSRQVPIVLSCCRAVPLTKSTMDGMADRFGFVVVYLEPTKAYNDVARARGPGPPLPDAVWTGQVIDEVLQSQNGDPSRVYSTGVSAGGTFSYRLACELPNKIAAIGSVAGIDVVPACKPTRPIAVIEIHGLKDTAIPFDGKPGFLSTPEVIAKWRGIDQCPSASKTTTSGILKEQVWSGCAGNTDVELATVTGAGHGWPPSSVDAPGVLWRFLSTHTLAPASNSATAKVLRASIVYKPARHVVVKLDLGQPSSLKLSLTRGTRKVAARTIAQAKAGAGTYTLGIPRKTKRGTLRLRVVVNASGSQVTLTRTLRLAK